MNDRKAKSLIPIAFISCLLFAAMSCSGDDNYHCEEATGACGTFTTCCTSTHCYYLADDGTRFDCDGTDCWDAAEALANYMCGRSARGSSPEDLGSMVEQARNAAREQEAAANCPAPADF